jgi:Tol biopolymer transport system component
VVRSIARVNSISFSTGSDLWTLPLQGKKKPQLLLESPPWEGLPMFSPDGPWIAYQSNESGRDEI